MSAPLPADDTTVLRFVDRLYEQAEEPDGWEDALRELAGSFSATGMALHRYDVRTRRGTALRVLHGPAASEFIPIYEEHSCNNVWMEKFRTGPMPKPGDVIASHRLYPEAQLVRHSYYNEFLKHFEIFASVGAVVETCDRELTTVTIVRDRRAGAYRSDEERYLRRVTPHLCNVHRVEQCFVAARASRTVLTEVLDLMPTAVFAVGPDLEVVAANRAARFLAGQADGLRVAHGKLEVSDPGAGRALRKLAGSLAAASRGDGSSAGGAVLAGRPSLSRPYAVTAIPARPLVPRDHPSAVSCLLLVEDPERAEQPAEHRLMALWNLTAGEARVSSLLVCGLSPREIADELEISFNTVRTHLRTTFAKTQTTGQADLVRLFTRLGLSIRDHVDEGDGG